MSDNNSNTAELNLANTELQPQDVKDYLLANPDFFARYPLLVEELKIPHQRKGSVSLVELQAEQLREKVNEFQGKLSELMSVARQNEAIYRIYADLNLKLFHCKSLADVKEALEETVCGALKLSCVLLHLFEGDSAMPEKERDTFLNKRLSKSDFFFGRLTQAENQSIFGEHQPQSAAIMKLKHDKDIGILAIGSDEEGHFYPGMDTLLIAQLQQFLSLIVPKMQG